jgi:phage tail-like protein
MKKNRLFQLKTFILLCLALPFIAAPGSLDRGTYVAGKYALELDGVTMGYLWSAEGGEPTGDVVTEKLGSDHVQRKHIGAVKYEDITIICGASMAPEFYQWIKDTLDHKSTRKNGAIVTMDNSYRVLSRMTFNNAMITEVGFPALDASSKDVAKLTVKLGIEYSTKSNSTAPLAGAASAPKLEKKWFPANFILRIDGLDDAMIRVNKIDPIIIKQKIVENVVGGQRDYEKEPSSIEFPNLVVTFPESHAASVEKWRDDFIVRGNNSEKTGSLEFLSPNLQDIYFKLTFTNLGIFKLALEKKEPGSDTVRRNKAEMYCEAMKFDTGN